MKILALVITNLKRFLRDWKSLILLTALPLLIVGSIFLVFSPNTLNVPLGTIDNTENFSYEEFKQQASRFGNVKEYENVDNCIEDVKKFETYFCAVIDQESESSRYVMDLHYDNTKEVIDRTVISGVKQVANRMQLDYSEEQVSKALGEVNSLTTEIKSARTDLNKTHNQLESKEIEINDSINRLNETDEELKAENEGLEIKIESLRDTRNNLQEQRRSMDENLEDTEENINDISESRQEFYQTNSERINLIQTSLSEAQNSTDQDIEELNTAQRSVSQIESDLNAYNNEIKRDVETADNLISQYDELQEDSEDYIRQINDTIEDLENTRSQIRLYRQRIENTQENLRRTNKEINNYQKDIRSTEEELSRMESKYRDVSELKPGEVAEFVDIRNNRIYSPEGLEPNLIVLQTVFSTILFLVILFVSVLISTFVTLNEINSNARERIIITPRTFIIEYLSVLITSLLLISIPVLCVIAVGNVFFKISILPHLAGISAVIFLFSTTLANLGIGLAYLIREKSITLFIGSFMVIFLIFMSGFILPTEMMNTIPKLIASNLPGRISQNLFDMKVLHQQPLIEKPYELAKLGTWVIISTITTIKIKQKRRKA